MRITSDGQVTIPADILKRAGLLPNTEFEFDGTGVRLVPAGTREPRVTGADFVARLSGSGDVKMSTDEIMALMRGDDRAQSSTATSCWMC